MPEQFLGIETWACHETVCPDRYDASVFLFGVPFARFRLPSFAVAFELYHNS